MCIEVCAGFKNVGGGAPRFEKSAAVRRKEIRVGGGGVFGAPIFLIFILKFCFYHALQARVFIVDSCQIMYYFAAMTGKFSLLPI